MAPRRHPLRNWIIGMYRSGVLATVQEGAVVASVPRQTVARWLREAKVNMGLARGSFIGRQHARAQRYLEGLPARRPPTKRQSRLVLVGKMESWDETKTKHIPIGKRALPLGSACLQRVRRAGHQTLIIAQLSLCQTSTDGL